MNTTDNQKSQTNETACKYVSSRGLLKSCLIRSYTPVSSIRHLINYNTQDIQQEIRDKINDKKPVTIYVCSSALRMFFHSNKSMKMPYILVSGDADEDVPSMVFENNTQIRNAISNPYLIHWFSQNLMFKDPKLSHLPIGLDYHTDSTKTPIEQERELESIIANSKPLKDRMIKCYSNFHFFMIHGHSRYDRPDAMKGIPKDLVYYEPVRVSRNETWRKQAEYAFVVSPHGNGMDCHRTWEALILGCIPIVKTSPIDSLYDDLPVLIVKQWSDVTMELLIQTHNDFVNRMDEFNMEKLTLKYWINRINNTELLSEN